jgi:hypothetical protein
MVRSSLLLRSLFRHIFCGMAHIMVSSSKIVNPYPAYRERKDPYEANGTQPQTAGLHAANQAGCG